MRCNVRGMERKTLASKVTGRVFVGIVTSEVISIFFAAATAFPQQQPTVEVELGRTMQEIVTAFGSPQECYVGDIHEHRFTPTECGAAEDVYDNVRDVYTRKTKTNEYELRMGYGVDSSKSKLHPDLRLEDVEMIIDKPKPFVEIASDLPEVKRLCAGGCSRFGTISGACTINGPVLVLYPRKLAEEDQANAEKVASGFGDSAGKEGPKDWFFAICLGWTDGDLMERTRNGDHFSDGKIVYSGPTANDVDWLKHPIEQIEITVESPSFLKSEGELDFGPRPAVVDLGEYKP
jgi:hypothetical protein